MTGANKYWTLITVLLVVIIIIGGIVAWSRYSPSQPVEISIPQSQELQGEIYIGGAVATPGFYPLKSGDSIGVLIQAAGGATSDADLSQLKLYLTQLGDEEPPQKVNLNRAEVWLLEALPGIGKVRAQDIVAYHNQNGYFRNINELTKVKGIGTTTYEQIKHLITVTD